MIAITKKFTPFIYENHTHNISLGDFLAYLVLCVYCGILGSCGSSDVWISCHSPGIQGSMGTQGIRDTMGTNDTKGTTWTQGTMGTLDTRGMTWNSEIRGTTGTKDATIHTEN